MKFTAKSTARFDTDAIVNRTVDKAMQRRLELAQAKVSGLTCPDHHVAATVSMEGSGAKRTLTVTGCCDSFKQKAMALIRQK